MGGCAERIRFRQKTLSSQSRVWAPCRGSVPGAEGLWAPRGSARLPDFLPLLPPLPP